VTTTINEKCAEWQFRAEVMARFAEPVYLPAYTVATLPAASAWPQCLVYVSDGTGNKRLGVSDGTNWRFPDGNVVS
jgi:hypothetical protein